MAFHIGVFHFVAKPGAANRITHIADTLGGVGRQPTLRVLARSALYHSLTSYSSQKHSSNKSYLQNESSSKRFVNNPVTSLRKFHSSDDFNGTEVIHVKPKIIEEAFTLFVAPIRDARHDIIK